MLSFGAHPIPFVNHLGFTLHHMANGESELRYTAKPEHLNTFDVTHGGASMTLMDVDTKEPLLSVASFDEVLRIAGQGRGGREKSEDVRPAGLAPYVGRRARKGRRIEGFPKPLRLLAG